MSGEATRLRLGPAVVQQLIMQRRPLLFVDTVTGYERTPRPSLRASRYISANDETFAGHFPHLAIWPGIYTVEGLNQTCGLLATISALQKHWESTGGNPADVLDSLRALDRQYELKTPLQAAAVPLRELMQAGHANVGLSAGIDIRFTAPVFPGSRLDYAAVEISANDTVLRYDVEALVDNTPVARGKLTLALSRLPLDGTAR